MCFRDSPRDATCSVFQPLETRIDRGVEGRDDLAFLFVPIALDRKARGVSMAAAAERFGDLGNVEITLGTKAAALFSGGHLTKINRRHDFACGQRNVDEAVVIAVDGAG